MRTGLKSVLAAAAAVSAIAATPVATQDDPMEIRISTPAVPGDWHAEMLYIFKEYLERSAPGEFDVQVFLSGTLFAQGTEPVAMQRGNLEMAMISAQDIARQLPQYSLFTAGYLIRSPEHQQAVFNGDVGAEYYQAVSEEMGIHVLDIGYLGTRQLNLREVTDVQTPADLDGITLRMPGASTAQGFSANTCRPRSAAAASWAGRKAGGEASSTTSTSLAISSRKPSKPA